MRPRLKFFTRVRRRTRRSAATFATVTLAASLLTGCSHATVNPATTTSAHFSAPTGAATAAPAALPSGDPDAAAPGPAAVSHTSAPASINIPSIGVHSSLQALGLESDGSLVSPSKWQVAGWYAGGVRPGDPGPAVVAGHVDSVNGPAVFYRLKEVKPGQTAVITQRNGHTLTFVVDTVNQYPKNKFPTAAVYGPTALPVLRLVTCTGDFDRAAHSYVDNLVVSAHLRS